jgi:hypothetical protein
MNSSTNKFSYRVNFFKHVHATFTSDVYKHFFMHYSEKVSLKKYLEPKL